LAENWVKLLGIRGSLPVSGREFIRYGGGTTCVLLRLGGQYLLVDGGSGLLRLEGDVLREQALPLILTHGHADHLLGLPLCPYLLRSGRRMDIYAAARNGLGAEAQVSRLLSPPLWPVRPDTLPAEIHWHALPDSLDLGEITVHRMDGVHPGGVSLLRISGGGRTVIVLSDCTLTPELLPAVKEFARGCDLLLCDGQYSESEWPDCADFGHSTWKMAARFAADCGAGMLRVVHHDPRHSDLILDAAEAEVREIFPGGALAREGEVVDL
jgi:ribonuclease BN (tRNA processing enzyme)